MNIYAIIAFINAITITGLGGFVVIKHYKQETHRQFFIFTLVTALWSYAYFFWQVADTSEAALLWSRILMAGAIFIPMTYLHYIILFTQAGEKTKQILKAGYIFGFISLLADFTPYFVKSVTPKFGFAFWPDPGTLFHPFLVIWLFYVMYTLIYAFRTFLRSSGTLRSQLAYIVLGTAIGYLGGLTNFFLWYNIPVPPVGNIFISFYVACLTYAIVRYRLFDIQIQLQKFINTMVPIGVSMTVSILLGFFLFRHVAIHRLISTLIVLFVYTVLLSLLRKAINRSQFSYLLFRKTYFYRQALLELAHEAATVLNFSELTKRIILVFVEKIGSEKAALLFTQPGKTSEWELLESEGYNNTTLNSFIAPTDDIFLFLKEQKEPVSIDDIQNKIQQEQNQYRKGKLRALYELFTEAEIHLFIPLRVHNAVIGCIVLGDKSGGRVYTIEDIELLNEAAPNLAIALLNCKQHQEKTILARMLQEEVDRAVHAWQQKSQENEELSNVKSQFITVASHQLRTPISVIRNSLQMVLEDYLIIKDNEKPLDPETAKAAIRLLSNAFLASDNLKNTADHILAASEFIGGKPNVHVKQLVTDDFFQTRVKRAQHLLDMTHKPITFQVTLDAQLPKSFVSDERKCAMIIDNILANAVLYTQKGHIDFKVSADTDECLIEIVDTGIGIPEEEQEKLFKRFIRLQNATSVVPDGSGLGLYLAKKYVGLLRGSIAFQSELGKGTTFTIRIPLHYSYIAN